MPQKNLKEINKSLQALCLSGQGKGRLEHQRARHVFDYQSLLDKKTSTWSVGFDLPVIGQEMMHLNYAKATARGTFERRLALEIKSTRDRRLLQDFYGKLSELILLVHQGKEKNSNQWNFSLSQESFVIIGGPLTLKAFSFDGQHFKRTTIRYQIGADKNKNDLVLQLFSSQCH